MGKYKHEYRACLSYNPWSSRARYITVYAVLVDGLAWICYRSTARRSAGNIWWGCTRATAGGKLMHWVLTCCLGWNTITCAWIHSQECKLTWLPRWINKCYPLYFPCPGYCIILYRYSVQVLFMQWSWWVILKWQRPSDLFVSLTDSSIAWIWAIWRKAFAKTDLYPYRTPNDKWFTVCTTIRL